MRKIILLAATLFFLSGMVAFATDYDGLFARTDTVDGIYADLLSTELKEAFLADPGVFLDAVMEETPQRQDKIAALLRYSLMFDHQPETEATLRQLAEVHPEHRSFLEGLLLEREESAPQAPQAPITDDHPFDPELCRKTIDEHLDTRAVSGEFYNAITKWYTLSPTLFAEITADLPAADIRYLGKAIRYSLDLSGETAPDATPNKESTGYKALVLIRAELSATDGVSLSDLRALNEEAIQQRYNAKLLRGAAGCQFRPTIGRMCYTADTLTITLSETTATSSSRTYWAEAYQVTGDTKVLVAQREVILPPGVSTLIFHLDAELTETDSTDIYLKIYAQKGGRALASQTQKDIPHQLSSRKLPTQNLTADWDSTTPCYQDGKRMILGLCQNNGSKSGPLADTKKLVVYDYINDHILSEYSIDKPTYVMTAAPYKNGIVYVEYDGVFNAVSWRLVYAEGNSRKTLDSGVTDSWDNSPMLFTLGDEIGYLWEKTVPTYCFGVSFLQEKETVCIFESAESQLTNMQIPTNSAAYCFSTEEYLLIGNRKDISKKVPLDKPFNSFGMTESHILCGYQDKGMAVIPIGDGETKVYNTSFQLYRIACSGNNALCVDESFRICSIDAQTGKVIPFDDAALLPIENSNVDLLPIGNDRFLIFLITSEYFLYIPN